MADTQKNYNKTIIQSSITNLEALYYLLKTVKENQPMTYDDGKTTIFPAARARLSQDRGGEWDPNKNDTHTSITLAEMNLIRYENEDATTFSVSDFGNRFLDTFTLSEIPASNGKFKLQLDDHYSKDISNKFILDLLLGTNVVQTQYGRNNHPYLILFKLLTESELNGYITKSEWARFINASEFLTDDQYDQIKNAVILVRKNNLHFDPVKSDRALTKLVQWGVLKKYATTSREEPLRFGFSAEFAPTIKLYMLNGDIRTEASDTSTAITAEIDELTRMDGGTNILLYGVPGCGKSWTIAHEYCNDDDCMERLVFHPDYMYSDFVGQILPVVRDDKVRYEFTPGPFVKLLKKAYWNPTKSYFLIVEEINRGNAPAIFGEIFQLLDRKTKDGDGFRRGTSEYGITNANIAREVYGDENIKVRIPGNMSIIGTMNTSDQNVFTLDTAFQRRWIMRMIPNSFKDHEFAEKPILDTEVSWQQFCEAINDEILRRNNITSSEDKRLGAYFITEDDLVLEEVPKEATEIEKKKIEHKNSRFAEKVIKYLWDDAFRFSHPDTFDTRNYNSLEMVIEGFMSTTGKNRFRVYHENLRKLILDGKQTESNIVSEETEEAEN